MLIEHILTWLGFYGLDRFSTVPWRGMVNCVGMNERYMDGMISVLRGASRVRLQIRYAILW